MFMLEFQDFLRKEKYKIQQYWRKTAEQENGYMTCFVIMLKFSDLVILMKQVILQIALKEVLQSECQTHSSLEASKLHKPSHA